MLRTTLTAVAAVIALCGCTTALKAPVTTAAPLMSPAQAYDIWDRVLTRHVDARGRIDFAGVAQDRSALDRFVDWVYAVAPSNRPGWFSTRADVLAYHINAYNALAMFSAIDYGIPEKLGALDRLRFFVLRKVRVGGQRLSLYAYENDVIRPLGDARVHVALNCMAVSCPRLPQTAFRPAGMDAALDRAAREFFNSPRYVVVDDPNHSVQLSAILDFYPEDFLATSPSLIAYVNRYRAVPIPPGYAAHFLDYDWTLNRQPDG